MGRIRASIFTLVSAAITALCVWLVLQSMGDERTFAIGASLFFGACTLVFIAFLVPAQIPPADAEGAIIIPNSRLRGMVMALALIAITASALLIWPVIEYGDDWRRFVFLLIPAPCAALALMYLFGAATGKPAYRFDRQGVTRYQWGQRTTPWSAVTGVRMLRVRNTESVVLDVTPEHRQQSGAVSRMGSAVGFGDVTLASGASGLQPKDIEALVRRYWQPRR